MGRRHLRPRLLAPARLGSRGSRAARAARRRDGARRRLRDGPGHRRAARAAAPRARHRRRRRRRRWSTARAAALGDRASTSASRDLRELEPPPSRSTRVLHRDLPLDPRPRPSSSRACTPRCYPAGRLEAQCGGTGQRRERRRRVDGCRASSRGTRTSTRRRSRGTSRRPRRPSATARAPASSRCAAWLERRDAEPPDMRGVRGAARSRCRCSSTRCPRRSASRSSTR